MENRFRITIGQGFFEPSHRFRSYPDLDSAWKDFEAIANHPRRTRFAELYFVQADGSPQVIAHTRITLDGRRTFHAPICTWSDQL